jgi:virginiamycin B lyase
MITGSVYGFDKNNQLEPIAWASVYANNGQQTFVAYTGGGGYYQMTVAQGTYNVTGVESGYKSYSENATVTSQSAVTVNFYLEPAGSGPSAVSPIQKFALTEWSLPTSGSVPFGIGTDTMGNVWVTENTANKLARFSPSDNTFTEWSIPTPNSQPHNEFVKLVATSDGSITQIFFTEFAASKIARFDSSTNTLTEWTLPAGSNPAGIYVDENNDVWFAESGRDAIGRLIPSTGQLTEWTLPDASSTPSSPSLKPWSVYVQVVTTPSYSNRFVWFTETLGNKIGRLEVTSNRLTIWDLGSLGLGAYQPNDLTIGIFETLPVAIITNGNNKVSVIGNDTGGNSLYQETTLPTLGAGGMGVTYDPPRNAAWFAENNVGNIANLNTTNVLAGQVLTPTYCTIAPLAGTPSCSSPATMLSTNITNTVNNLPGTSQLVSPVAPTSTVNIYQGPVGGITEYSLPGATSGPTYVFVDSIGNVWFTEAFGNKIGRLTPNINPQITTTVESSYITSISTSTTVSQITTTQVSNYGSSSSTSTTVTINSLISTTPSPFHVTISLSSTDTNGTLKSQFVRGETVLIRILVSNDGATSLANVHILLTIYDSNNVPIFFGISITNLNAGAQQILFLGTPLASTLPTGTFSAQVIVLTDFLASGGSYIPDGSGTVTFSVT